MKDHVSLVECFCATKESREMRNVEDKLIEEHKIDDMGLRSVDLGHEIL
jgi:hypothetical protein